jgi:NDP-hexose-3-ketoreductase
MQVLLLGNSDIGRRRVLPALAHLGVERVDIATRTRATSVAWPQGLSGVVFSDYEEAIVQTAAPLVWISTVNSAHKALALAAMEAGKQVVIDKPATTCLADTRELVDKAGQTGRILAEATVYPWHPQISAAQGVFAQADSAPRHIVAAFSYPPLPPDNFRHRPELGGGILLDLGPYAVSIGRVFFAAAPQQVFCRRDADDRAFSVLMTYPGERTLVGQFGTNTGYVNQVILLGSRVVVDLQRVFTTAPDTPCIIHARVDDQPHAIEVDPTDTFERFLIDVFAAIDLGQGERFLQQMLEDAEVLHRLASTKEQRP